MEKKKKVFTNREPVQFDKKKKYETKNTIHFEQEVKAQPVTTKSLTVAKKISSEMKIYGVNACSAAFKARPQDIVRVYIEQEKVKQFSKILKQCATKKIAYKIISQEELSKVTDTTHNEGVCFLIKKKEVFNFKKFLSRITPEQKNSCVIALENVQNPHNVGAILRVCANFAVDAMLLQEPQLAQSGAVYRTAEGGAEWVQILETGELLKAVEEFKKQGFKIYGTSSHTGMNSGGYEGPNPRVAHALQKIHFAGKSIILFGSESDGLSPALLKCCDQIIYIPQSGNVESLNVSCAASVILYEYYKTIKI